MGTLHMMRCLPRRKKFLFTVNLPQILERVKIGPLEIPNLADNQGDRILSVDINDSGLYFQSTDLTPAFIDFNTSVKISGIGLVDLNKTDFDGDGHIDFQDAEIHGVADFKLKKFRLDGDGTFQDWTEVDKSKTLRGLFIEQPSIELLDGRNLSTVRSLKITKETLEGGRGIVTKEASGSSPFTFMGANHFR